MVVMGAGVGAREQVRVFAASGGGGVGALACVVVSIDERCARHARVSRVLQRLDDRQLRELMDRGVRLGAGVGGPTLGVDVDDVPVFVKCVPLTDVERQPQWWGSTANYFDLPALCHYGIGSPGFGAWRELAMLARTTAAVLDGRVGMFPLTYHWRVLPDVAVELPAELRDVQAAVAYWGQSSRVRARLQALAEASAVVAVFQERLPHSLEDWLTAQARRGAGVTEAALHLVEDRLQAGVAWMNADGWLHFDAHFDNVLTDGEQLYFADFGLALADSFDLSGEENDFAARHTSYDHSYVLAQLVRWLIIAFGPGDPQRREAVIEAAANGQSPTGMPAYAATLLARYAPVAHTATAFYRELQTRSRDAVYPEREIRQALSQLRTDDRLR